MILIGNDGDELREPIAADRRHSPELAQMPSDRVRDLDALTHQHKPNAMQRHDALLLRLLISTKRMLARVTASQIASASAASFF